MKEVKSVKNPSVKSSPNQHYTKLFLFIFIFSLILIQMGGVMGVGTYPNCSSDPTSILCFHLNNNASLGENFPTSNVSVDSSSYLKNGTIINGTIANNFSILNDGAFTFNNQSNFSYITVSHNNSFNIVDSNLSICSWVYLRQNSSQSQFIVGKYPATFPEYGLYIAANTLKPSFLVRNSSNIQQTGVSSVALSLNTWSFVCGTYNSNDGFTNLYVNGLKTGTSATGVLGNFSNGQPVIISGRRATEGFLNATLDEFIMWNRTLTDYQIWVLYHRNSTSIGYLDTLNVTEDMTIPYNATLTGTTFQLNDTGNTGVINITGNNIYLDCNGMILIGNDTTTKTTYNSSLDDLRVGILMSNWNDVNNSVSNCNVRNYSTGILSRGNNSILSFNNFSYNVYAIAITTIGQNSETGAETSGAKVFNNLINDAVHFGIETRNNVMFANISNNIINRTDWDGIEIRGGHSIIKNNTVIESLHHALDIFSFTFEGNNTFEYNSISRTGQSVNSYDHYIYVYRQSNNVFRHNIFNGGTGSNGSGIAIQGIVNDPSFDNRTYIENTTLFNNTFFNVSRYCIVSGNAKYTNFSSNNCTLVGQAIGFFDNSFNSNETFLNNYQNNSFISVIKTGSGRIKINKTIDSIYLNTSLSLYNFNITINHSLINALLYSPVLLTICGSSNINSNDGNINCTIASNNSLYVLDNLNLTEDVTRENSPLGFTASSDDFNKYITNLLGTTLNQLTTTFDVNSCETVGRIRYTSHSGDTVRTFNKGSYTCSNNQVTLVLDDIEPATGSNHLEINYDACTPSDYALYRLIVIMFILLILVPSLIFIKKGLNIEFNNLTVDQIIILAVTIIIGVALAIGIANVIGSFCPV